ncbi:B3/B4 domain-containing protein [Paracoccus rhizosphaerae]|uniref:B3/4 domain-containing protein n=1 Tax=Paracoccus rhizosphaerae TaxID=1133347 RepID=A0ABV6CJ80_9RHOB|nr:phenylalanine--tRNA ligase beta subunit-related protein [Paracoccus rhizosphaerae]
MPTSTTFPSIAYSPAILSLFPQLNSRALLAQGIDQAGDPADHIAALQVRADQRLQESDEAAFPEIQAWRRALSTMGLRPTQYRCAAEALLRRRRKEGDSPALHPLIDLCNAASLAFAIPVAVFDLDRVAGAMTIRPAQGNERFERFDGGLEHPEPGEVVFVDASARAHSRRWTHRQSGYSAIRRQTTTALIVMEALHETAGADLTALTAELARAIAAMWRGATVTGTILAGAITR